MQSNFEMIKIQNAKVLLEKELQMAKHIHEIQKEKHEAQQKKPSFYARIKHFFSTLF